MADMIVAEQDYCNDIIRSECYLGIHWCLAYSENGDSPRANRGSVGLHLLQSSKHVTTTQQSWSK